MDREHYEGAYLPKSERIGQAVPKEPMAGQPGPAIYSQHRETRMDVSAQTPEHQLGLRVLEILTTRSQRIERERTEVGVTAEKECAWYDFCQAARSLGLLPADAKEGRHG